MLVRTLALSTLVAVLATVLVTTGSASSTGKTLRFVDSQQSFTLDPPGDPSIGSRLIITKLLYNRGNQFGMHSGARVGSAEVICTVVSAARAQCTVTAHVPNGEVVAMGAMRLTANGLGTNTFAIVGGAGAYSAARGTVVSRDLNQAHTLVTLHVTG
jgi:hypothetical protein